MGRIGRHLAAGAGSGWWGSRATPRRRDRKAPHQHDSLSNGRWLIKRSPGIAKILRASARATTLSERRRTEGGEHMIYELRIYTIRPGIMAKYLDIVGNVGMKIRGNDYGKLVGTWSS